MIRVGKWIFAFLVLVFAILVAYAYLGPLIGADLSPKSKEVRQEIVIEFN
ncbi:MAG: hypothetical protein OXD29_01330 [Roseovarius sp.]|nr:hypothetical protein [Roseovarius sp.]MCY4206578.1 hypothetical protein [Roseovarius sp.]MCY4292997.1 hypothetical protein [Roseovarius sp.]MCY4314646.1 hypothetical protein [Roseovarius sp.]